MIDPPKVNLSSMLGESLKKAAKYWYRVKSSLPLVIKTQILMTSPECTNKAQRNQDERLKSADLAFQPSLKDAPIEQGNIPNQEAMFNMRLNLDITQEPYFLMVLIQLVYLFFQMAV